MKNEEENKLNEVWETPEVTMLDVNKDTNYTGKHGSGADGGIFS
jgi:hypothetical protein